MILFFCWANSFIGNQVISTFFRRLVRRDRLPHKGSSRLLISDSWRSRRHRLSLWKLLWIHSQNFFDRKNDAFLVTLMEFIDTPWFHRGSYWAVMQMKWFPETEEMGSCYDNLCSGPSAPRKHLLRVDRDCLDMMKPQVNTSKVAQRDKKSFWDTQRCFIARNETLNIKRKR